MSEKTLRNPNSHTNLKQRSLYVPIFSNTRHTYMHDLLINSQKDKQNKPPYFHIFINVNTRKGYAIPLHGKTADDIKKSIKTFLSKVDKCNKLISDAESSFISDKVVNYLKVKDIDVQINDEQNHKTLGIIDRFIRTIRDKHGSNHAISTSSMNRIIDEYNDEIHSATKMKPNDMGKDEEISYISRMILKRNKVKELPDFDIKEGDYVRLFKQKIFGTKKRRFLTKHYYVVESIDKNRIVVMAKDGATKTVSRADVAVIDKNTNLTQASTINGGARGDIVRILKYNPRRDTYRVEFKTMNGKPYYQDVSTKNLRSQFPMRATDIELEYFKKNPQDKH